MNNRYDDIYGNENEDVEQYYNKEPRRNDNAYRITKVNANRIKKLRKKVIKRITIFGMAAVMVGVGLKIYHNNTPMAQPIPDGYTEIYVDEFVDYGESLDDIVTKYYTGELTKQYPNFDDYKDAIIDKNNISFGKVKTYETIKVPVVVEKNNVYLQEIEKLEQELASLDRWVSYELKSNDTIYSVAWLGAKNPDEVNSIAKEIIDRNGINPGILQLGQPLYIVNPRIGEISRTIEEKKDEFIASITVSETKTK